MSVELARKLRLPIVAEGIESKSDAEFVQALGCETGQGCLFARPMPQEEFVTWLCTHNAQPAMIGQLNWKLVTLISKAR